MVNNMQSENAVSYDDLLATNQINHQDNIIREKLDQRIRPYLLTMGFLCVLVLLETYRWYVQAPAMPLVVFGFFAASLVFVLFQLLAYQDHMRFLRLGKHGEPLLIDVIKAHGEQTNSIVYKDVVVGKESLDFMLVNQAGLTLIKVCDWRTPSNNEAVINYDDEKILLNGYQPDANPLVPLKNIKRWFDKKLYASLGKPVEITCLVVFPEWFVRSPSEPVMVKVLNPREVSAVFANSNKALSDNDKCLLNYHVGKLIKHSSQ